MASAHVSALAHVRLCVHVCDSPMFVHVCGLSVASSHMYVCVSYGCVGVHGWGIFALRDIPAGTLVSEYRGVCVRPSVAEVLEQKYRDSGRDCYFFKVCDLSVCVCVCVRARTHTCLDAYVLVPGMMVMSCP